MVRGSSTQLAVNVAGILVSHFAWSLLLEHLTTIDSYVVDGQRRSFTNASVITLFQSFFAYILASIVMRMTQQHSLRRGDMVSQAKLLTTVVLCQIVGQELSIMATSHISFPLLLTIKMCKPTVVVVVGIVIFRFRFSFEEVQAALLLVGGSFLFTLDDSGAADISGGNAMKGLSFAMGHLLADGVVYAAQDSLRQSTRWSAMQLQQGCTAAAALAALVTVVVSEIRGAPSDSAVRFFWLSPRAFTDVVALSFCNAFGQLFIYRTVAQFGTLTLALITILRKVGSLLLSVVIYDHTLSLTKIIALMLVAAGLISDVRGHGRPRRGDKKLV